METAELSVKQRKTFRKRVRYLRRQGVIPANIYGAGTPSRALEVDKSAFLKVLTRAGHNTPVKLTIEGEGEPETAFIWKVQRHPVTEEILHADFYKLDFTKPVEVNIPLHLVGEAPAVRLGATIIQGLAELHVECLPTAIPRFIEVNVATLTELDQHLSVKDLQVPSGVTVLSRPDLTVVRAAPPRKEEEPAPVAAPVEGAVAPAAEGEAAPAAEGKPEAPAAEAKGKAPAPEAKGKGEAKG
ncbi:MAG: 50S ribosomal protein L25 [Chloroflexi bacterium]|nr:50S ribosomal protein L25 [Chloroflexota bacterium]